jgi:hypothetical protein
MRGLLVVAQTALALMLLAGAGLMVRSFAQLTTTRLGFDPKHLLTFRLDQPRDATDEARQLFFEQVLERAGAIHRRVLEEEGPALLRFALDSALRLAGRSRALSDGANPPGNHLGRPTHRDRPLGWLVRRRQGPQQRKQLEGPSIERVERQAGTMPPHDHLRPLLPELFHPPLVCSRCGPRVPDPRRRPESVRDTDKDGYPDTLESVMGSDPFDAASDPFGGSVVDAPLTLSKVRLRLDFHATFGQIWLYGTLNVPAGFNFHKAEVGRILRRHGAEYRGHQDRRNRPGGCRQDHLRD